MKAIFVGKIGRIVFADEMRAVPRLGYHAILNFLHEQQSELVAECCVEGV